MSTDTLFMLEAIQLAKKGWYSTHPNPRVGCVLVKEQKIIARGWHQFAGQGHAEVNALKEAGEKARGATAYVTLEPCSHFGKTPPCSNALIDAGITEVVVAMQDPNPLVAGQGIERLRAAGIPTRVGILEQGAQALNRGFIKRMQTQQPFVRCKMGVSLDGRTAMASGESQWITGPAARHDVQRLRAESSAVMTGIGTVIADDPSLNVREEEYRVKGIQPSRVVLDSRLRISAQAKMLGLEGKTYIFTDKNCIHDSQAKLLAEQGAELLGLELQEDSLDLNLVMQQLAQLQFNEVLLETGPTLSGAMLNAGYIDELVIYMAPKLMGDKGRGLFHIPGLEKMCDVIEMEMQDIRNVGSDLRLTLRVKN